MGYVSRPLWSQVLFNIASVGMWDINSHLFSYRKTEIMVNVHITSTCFLANFSWLKVEVLFLVRFCNLGKFELKVMQLK